MSLFAALSVSASGLAAQRTRAELLAENLANAGTTRTPAGGPYRRKAAVFAAEPVSSAFAETFQAELNGTLTGVRVVEIVEDSREPEKRYLPGHPHADREGYVAFPRINPAEDMVDLLGAVRGYQANLAAISAIKDMIHRSIELLR